MFRLGLMSMVSAFVCGLGCGGDLPRPDYVGQDSSALFVVPYPPPPARVEAVSKKPRSGAVWIDGEWAWQGRRFAWRKGRWVVPPAGARFSPWTMVRGEDGTVYYAGGIWRDAQKRLVADPPPLAAVASTVGDVVDPQGEDEATGRNVHESGEGDGGIADADRDDAERAVMP